MKKYFILSVLLLVSGFFASCNYLNIDDYFEDTFQEDSIYANKRNIERYFNGAAALLPVLPARQYDTQISLLPSSDFSFCLRSV